MICQYFMVVWSRLFGNNFNNSKFYCGRN